jgi:tetratricopeptide (TPR) repeat protein
MSAASTLSLFMSSPPRTREARRRPQVRGWLTSAVVLMLAAWLGGCQTPKAPDPVKPPVATTDPTATQRQNRADSNLQEGLARYETGSYDNAQRSLLVALDSGLLTAANQVLARKHLAFIHCISNRESSCREEFEKVLAIDPKFTLTAAEAGHPSWGTVFRNLRAETEARKAGRTVPAPTPVRGGVRLLAEGMNAYEASEYNRAIKLFTEAQREGLDDNDRIKAIKHSAFSYCVTNRNTPCQAEFARILELKPEFTLGPAEAGHPLWGPAFRAAKSKQKLGKK